MISTLHASKSLALSKENQHLPPTDCHSQPMQYMATAVCSVSEGVTVGSALSPSMSSSFTKALGMGRTASESSNPRSSDASMTRKNKLWPFSKVRHGLFCGKCSHCKAACVKLTAVSVLTWVMMLLQKVLEGDPAMTLIQLDVKRGNVNDIVNDSIRSSYQVRQASVHAFGRILLPNISVNACNMRRTSDSLVM